MISLQLVQLTIHDDILAFIYILACIGTRPKNESDIEVTPGVLEVLLFKVSFLSTISR